MWSGTRTRVGGGATSASGPSTLDGATTAGRHPVPGPQPPGARPLGLRAARSWRSNPTSSWRTVPTALTPDSSEWRIRLEPTEDGTRIEQRYDIVRGAGPLEAVYATILPSTGTGARRSRLISADWVMSPHAPPMNGVTGRRSDPDIAVGWVGDRWFDATSAPPPGTMTVAYATSVQSEEHLTGERYRDVVRCR